MTKKLARLAAVLAALVAVPAAGQTVMDGTDVGHEAQMAGLNAALMDALNDPFSAMMRQLVFYPNVVCGQINAKNRFGAYVGFEPFVWNPTAVLPIRRMMIANGADGGYLDITVICNSAARAAGG